MCVRIPARTDDPHSHMQKMVVFVILADHQRGMFRFATISMMHFHSSRQRTTESQLGARPVHLNLGDCPVVLHRIVIPQVFPRRALAAPAGAEANCRMLANLHSSIVPVDEAFGLPRDPSTTTA